MNKLMLQLYHDPLTPEEATIKLKKEPCRLQRWDDPVSGSPVTYIGRDAYYRVASLRRWIAEQGRPDDKSKAACRRPGRPGMVV
jgi:hypothetical protein